MSKENVEIAKRSYTDDPMDFFNLLDEEVEVDLTGFPLPDYAGVVQGRNEAIHLWRHYWGTWTEYSVRVHEAIDAGDKVVIVHRESGTGKASGVSLERTSANVWTFREGKVVRYQGFRTKEEALQAAGLSE
jgi:ketosteroid isomerase-like protein